jgi:hypothetical protein
VRFSNRAASGSGERAAGVAGSGDGYFHILNFFPADDGDLFADERR